MEDFQETSILPHKHERNWAMVCHFMGLAPCMIGIPIIGTLIFWLLKKDESDYVNDQGKEALNFQITMIFIAITLTVGGIMTLGLGMLLFIPFGIYYFILAIIAGIKANDGTYYRYPMIIRLF